MILSKQRIWLITPRQDNMGMNLSYRQSAGESVSVCVSQESHMKGKRN